MKRNHLFEPLTRLAAGLAFLHLLVLPIYGQDAHELFTDVLRSHVQDGVVNYGALCNDQRLNAYIEHLESTNPADFRDRAQRLAFWINAYNAFTLKIVCENYPIQSINDLHWGGLYVGLVLKTTVWDRKFIRIGGRRLSLNDIEHKIIRPVFGDPRIHFALVCAATSCPPLRAEAFEASKLDEQLDDQGRIFLSETAKNRFDLTSKTAHLSKILDWYGDDFGKNDAQLLTYIARFLPAEISKQVLSNPAAWDIKHTDYDWGLNDFTSPRSEGRFKPEAKGYTR